MCTTTWNEQNKEKEYINMKTRKRIFTLFLALALIGSQFSLVGYSTIGGYEPIDGTPVQSVPPESLDEGEIWTGKSVAYHGDGTVTVTLSAWGSTWINPTNPGTPQLPLDPDKPYVKITDHIGEFKVNTETLPIGLSISDNNTVVWNVNQSNILGSSPAEVSFDIYLDEDNWRMGYWYSTGIADVHFYPVIGNPFYWTMVETTYDSFTTSMNWNNGNGLNSGTITDNILGFTIVLGSNTSLANQRSADAQPSHWANNARVGNQTYFWHLEWLKGGGPKTHIFTIRDLETPGIDITYEIVFLNAGGNTSIAGGRTLTSVNYFHRTFEENNPGRPFRWENDAVIKSLDVVAQVMLRPNSQPLGDLQINKDLQGWFTDWGVGYDVAFNAVLRTDEGFYLTFDELSVDEYGLHQYVYSGLVGTETLATVVAFSSNVPAVIRDMPVRETGAPGALTKTYFVEEILDAGGDLIEVTYSFNEIGFQLIENELMQATVTNNYQHGVGRLEIYKLFDGFAKDWGVNDDTEFRVRIWDVDAGNYLLFKNYQQPDGSFWCVGNHEFGLTERYEDMPIMEIPITANSPLKLSNLWTWGSYRVEEVRTTSTEPIQSYWDDFWNNTELDRDFGFNNRADGAWIDGTWLRETWIDFWEAVPEITDAAEWDEDNYWTWGVSYSENNSERALDYGETITITMSNHYKYSSGNMTIVKDLAGYPEHWGVDEFTEFSAGVKVYGSDDYLFFSLNEDGSFEYRPEGEKYTGELIQLLPFSAVNPAVIKGIDTEINYIVEEVFDKGSEIYSKFATGAFNVAIDYDKNDSALGGNIIATVTNTFEHGTGTLAIKKQLIDEPLSINADTDFYATVRDSVDVDNLYFVLQDSVTNTWRSVGNDIDWINKHVEEPIHNEIPFSVNKPAILTNMWPGCVYVVEELPSIFYKAEYEPLDIMWNGDELETLITNIFQHNTVLTYYTVTYDGNGYTDGVVPDSEVHREGNIVVVQEQGNMDREQYRFIGWNLQQDGKGEWWQPDETFAMPDHDVILWAQWELDIEPPPTEPPPTKSPSTAPPQTDPLPTSPPSNPSSTTSANTPTEAMANLYKSVPTDSPKTGDNRVIDLLIWMFTGALATMAGVLAFTVVKHRMKLNDK